MNKLAHTIILGFFALACRCLGGLLHLSGAVRPETRTLPAYTRLWLDIGPLFLTGLVVLAGLYCVWAWTRKSEQQPRWPTFLSATTAVFSFTMLLVVVAAYLPLVDALNRLGNK